MLHELGFSYNNLKPDNVFIGRLKFNGVSNILQSEQSDHIIISNFTKAACLDDLKGNQSVEDQERAQLRSCKMMKDDMKELVVNLVYMLDWRRMRNLA